MSTQLPQSTTGWKASQLSDKFGDIIRTRGLDLVKAGYITLGRKPIGLFSHTEDTDFGVPLVITNDATQYYIITTTAGFIYNPANQTVTQLPTIDAPGVGFQTDAAMYNAEVAVSGVSSLNTYNPGDGLWNHPTRITGLDSAYPHPVETFTTLAYVCVGNGNKVQMYDSSYNLIATLTIEQGYVVTGLRHTPGFMYISTRNISGKNARMFVWAGTFDGSANGTGAVSYDAEGDWIYSLCEYDSSVAIINSQGQLMRFSGNGFDQLDALPVYYSDYSWVSANSIFNILGKVASRGMMAQGKRIVLNIDGSIALPTNQYPGSVMPNQPSGVWVYDPDTGLTHRAGYVHEKYQSVAITAVDSDYLVLASSVALQVADPVVFLTTTLTGITAGQTYFAIPDGTQNTRIAISPYDAFQGNHLPVSGDPGDFDAMAVDVYSSVGATSIRNPGPVHPIMTVLPNVFFGTEFLFGGTAIDGTGSDMGILMSLGMGRNVGSFITARIPATSLTDDFPKMFAKLEQMFVASQYVLVNFRRILRFGVPMATSGLVTWASSTTFTINVQRRDFSAALVGDEIEIILGAGSGYTAHISEIDVSAAPTYTVTLDTVIPGAVAGQKFDFIIDNWTRLESFDLDGKGIPQGTLETAVSDLDSTWVQLKVELGGFKTQIGEVDVPSVANMNYD